ncbi:glycosyltransferase [Pseudoroseomonas cervicalis]|uniref:glycosyltransferase n=1 Tax=Teichococcus cervicalis TaxID=204525 RepID=UPI0022F1AB75|nr:glycosyltransferase [Pseudoroseomonas cervicalis]WBV43911.1 glycosyltransferase [Pseudoroseomonas cervicalis]
MTAPLQILLASYHGAAWLPEQLASLDAQQGAPDWQLLWRDDGSTDASAAILAAHPRARQAPGEATRLGPGPGFLALLAAAPEDAPAYAFCDQDDVWLPHKLASAWDWIAAQPAGRPALYCARQQLVDAALNPIGLSPDAPRPPGFGNALVQNIATGCTVMLNPAARQLILAAAPMPAASMHDWWAYLLVSGAGGALRFDPRPALLYRQHGRNSVGASGADLARARGALRRGAARFLDTLEAHCAALAEAGPLLTPQAREALAALLPLRRAGPLARLRLARRAGLHRQRAVEDWALRGLLLLG